MNATFSAFASLMQHIGAGFVILVLLVAVIIGIGMMLNDRRQPKAKTDFEWDGPDEP